MVGLRRLLLPGVLLLAALLPSRCVADRSATGKVSLELYYESLCPYCSRFIANGLAGIFEDGLIDAVDLRLVPYGNARVGSNGDISCQVHHQHTVAAWRSHATWPCSSVNNGKRRAWPPPIKSSASLAGFHLPSNHHLHFTSARRPPHPKQASASDPHPMAARSGALALAAALLLLASGSVEGTTTKVDIALYYESLCPYSASFVVNRLAKVFNNGLLDAIDLTLLPYGNAWVGAGGKISCQHGEYECFLNTVEACAIDAWPELNKHFQFIYCVEDLVMKHQQREWESCFAKLGFDPTPVTKCYKSERGHELELKYANQTDALVPPHRYVPWVVVDGQPLLEDYENFEAYICKAYKGSPPKVCEGLAMLQEAVQARNGVSFNSDEIRLEPVVSEGRESKVWLGDDDN